MLRAGRCDCGTSCQQLQRSTVCSLYSVFSTVFIVSPQRFCELNAAITTVVRNVIQTAKPQIPYKTEYQNLAPTPNSAQTHLDHLTKLTRP